MAAEAQFEGGVHYHVGLQDSAGMRIQLRRPRRFARQTTGPTLCAAQRALQIHNGYRAAPGRTDTAVRIVHVDLDQFVKVVGTIKDFWLTIVKLPAE